MKRFLNPLFFSLALACVVGLPLSASENPSGMSRCVGPYWIDYYNKLAEALAGPCVVVGEEPPPRDHYFNGIFSQQIYDGGDGKWSTGYTQRAADARLCVKADSIESLTQSDFQQYKNPIWIDKDGGRLGIYDAGVDEIIFSGEGGLSDGCAGVVAPSFFHNKSNGEIWRNIWSPHDDLDLCLEIMRNMIYTLMLRHYVNRDLSIMDDFTNLEEIPFLMSLDDEGNITSDSVKLFPERSGEAAYAFTKYPKQLPDGSTIGSGDVFFSLPSETSGQIYFPDAYERSFALPVHFEEIRQVLNKNLFKWSLCDGSWTDLGEKLYGTANAFDESWGTSFNNAVSRMRFWSQPSSIPGAACYGSASGTSYSCSVTKVLAYLQCEIPKNLKWKHSAEFYVSAEKNRYYLYWADQSQSRFDANGEPVVEDKWSRFAQHEENDAHVESAKFGNRLGIINRCDWPSVDSPKSSGFSVAEARIVLKWDGSEGLPEISLDKPTDFPDWSTSADTDRDDLVDQGVDLSDPIAETGTIVHLPEYDQPQVFIPLRAYPYGVSLTRECLSAGAANGARYCSSYAATESGDVLFNIPIQPFMSENRAFVHNHATSIFTDLMVEEENYHVKRLGIIRPRGQIVIFDFPWLADENRFSDFGSPLGIHSKRSYRLVHNTKIDPDAYSLMFDSGVVHVYDWLLYGFHNPITRVRFQAYSDRSPTHWRRVNSEDKNLYSKNRLRGFAYDIDFDWDADGKIEKIYYRTKDGSEVTEVTPTYGADGAVTGLSKKSPDSKKVGGSLQYSITASGNTITYPDGSTSTLSASQSNGGRTATITRTSPEGGTVKDTYVYNADGRLVSRKREFNETTFTTSYTYQTDDGAYPNSSLKRHKLASVSSSDGTWTQFIYDQNGQLSEVHAPFKDSTFDSGDKRVTELLYAKLDEDDEPDTKQLVEQPRTIITKIAGVETGRSYQFPLINYDLWDCRSSKENQRCAAKSAAWDAAGSIDTGVSYDNDNVAFIMLPLERVDASERTEFEHLFSGQSLFPEEDGVDSIRVDLKTRAYVYSKQDVHLRAIDTEVNPLGTVLSRSVVDVPSGVEIDKLTTTVDSFGRPVKSTFFDGRTMEFKDYCLFGPRTIIDLEGESIILHYNADGSLQKRESPSGVVEYSYDVLGNVVKIKQDPVNGNETTTFEYAYDAAGRIVSSKNGVGTFTYAYDGTSVAQTLPNGETRTFERYVDGSPKKQSGYLVRPMCFDYGADADSGAWSKTIPGKAMDGETWTRTIRNLLGLPLKTENSAGAWLESAYDESGRLTKTTSSNGGETTLAFDAKNKLAQVVEDGVATTFSHGIQDGRRVTSSETSVAAGTIAASRSVSLDGLNATSTINGKTTSVDVERRGNGKIDVTTKFPDGRRILRKIERNQMETSYRDNANTVASVTSKFDDYGRITSLFDREHWTYYHYRPETGDVKRINTSDGKILRIAYAAGDILPNAVTPPGGTTLALNFSETGELKGFQGTGEGIFAATDSYDDQGRKNAMETEGSAGTARTRWAYDPASGKLSEKRITGDLVHKIAYHSDGRLKTLSRAFEQPVSGQNDDFSDVKIFKYTAAPKLFPAGHTHSDGVTPEVTISGHDEFGNPASIAVAGIALTQLTYDLDQRTTSVATSAPDGTNAVETAYQYQNTRRSRMTRGENAVDYVYDTFGRLESVTSGDATATYEYLPGSLDIVTSVVVSLNGKNILTRYVTWETLVDRIKKVANIDGEGSTYDSFEYGYRPDTDKITSVKREDGAVAYYDYDARGQLTEAKHVPADSTAPDLTFAYESDSITNVLEGGRLKASGESEFEFAPDLRNAVAVRKVGDELEVSGTARADATVTVNGVRAERTGEAFTAVIALDNKQSAVAQPVKIIAVWFDPDATPESGSGDTGADIISEFETVVLFPKEQEAPVYDLGGRLLQNSLFKYEWNAEDQLTAVESKVGADDLLTRIENDYDHGDRRIRKKVLRGSPGAWIPVAEHLYHYDTVLLDGSPASFGVLTAQTTTIHATGDSDARDLDFEYLWGLDSDGTYQGLGGVGGLLTVRENNSGRTFVPTMDAKGNITGFVDAATKTMAAAFEYTPYGRILHATYADDETELILSQVPFRFQSKVRDPETGLYYFGFRWYDPSTTKWLTRDPIEERGGLNLYGYCKGDPVNGSDVLGCKSWWWQDLWTAIKNPVSVSSAGLQGAKTFLPYTDTDGRFTLGGNGGAWDFVGDRVSGLNDGSDIKKMKNFRDSHILPYYPATWVLNLNVYLACEIPADISFGYDVWKRGGMGRVVLYTNDPVKGWQTKIISSSDFTRMPQATVFINGILNPERNAGILGQSHTNTKISKNPFVLLHNPSYGFIPDMVECVFGKLGQASNTSKQMAELLAKRALCNRGTELIMHSQGTLIGTNALRIIRDKYGIYNWSNLTTEYHGSAANLIWARYFTAGVGGRFDKMINHSGDAVGIWVGNNAFDPYSRIRSFIKTPSLGFDVIKYPSGYFHSEHTIYFNE